MKHHNADIAKNNKENPIRENEPNSISDGLKAGEKEGYSFPDKKDKQYKDQPEFIAPEGNKSKDQ